MNRRTTLLSAMLLLLAAAAPASAGDPPRLVNRFVALGTGPVSGTYFPVGAALAKVMNSRAAAETVFVVPTAGSLENLHLLARGDIRFAFCQSDLATWAANGDRMFSGAPMKNLRAVAALYPEAVQVVTRADSPLRSLPDLRGRRVGIGPGRSGTQIHAETLLAAFGLSRAEVTADMSDFALALEKLGDGSLDAVFLTAGAPTAAVAEFALRHPVRLLPIPEERARALLPAHPFLARTTIPAGTYAGQTGEVATVATRALLVTTTETSRAEVDDLLHALFQQPDFISAAHPCARGIDRAKAAEGVPREFLHEAAREFFR